MKKGFPVLLKAAAGGGGKGLRVVRKMEDLESALTSVQTEAKNSFGDSTVLLEKYFERVKHIEFQLFGDKYGDVVHIFERECSMQRRHQKVVEVKSLFLKFLFPFLPFLKSLFPFLLLLKFSFPLFSFLLLIEQETPSPFMDEELMEEMGEAVLKIGKVLSYIGAGTVEFIVDESRNFYFLEVNTRLQVEHPVTEMTTNTDLVYCQIEVARGYTLEEVGLKALKRRGHSIEVRLYAEDPLNNFLPSVGRIHKIAPLFPLSPSFSANSGSYSLHSESSNPIFDCNSIPSSLHPKIRVDSYLTDGSEITVYYDPMIAKFICFAQNRKDCVSFLVYCLKRLLLMSTCTTNLEWLVSLLQHPSFLSGKYHTLFIEKEFSFSNSNPNPNPNLFSSNLLEGEKESALACVVYDWYLRNKQKKVLKNVKSGFRLSNYSYQRTVLERVTGKGKENGIVHFVHYNCLDTSSSSKFPHLFNLFLHTPKPISDKGQEKEGKEGLQLHEWKTELKGTPFKVNFTKTVNLREGVEEVYLEVNDVSYRFYCSMMEDLNTTEKLFFVFSDLFGNFAFSKREKLWNPNQTNDSLSSNYVASMPAQILSLAFKSGDFVKKGDLLITWESMKMEVKLNAHTEGIVTYKVKEGQVVKEGTLLLDVQPIQQDK